MKKTKKPTRGRGTFSTLGDDFPSPVEFNDPSIDIPIDYFAALNGASIQESACDLLESPREPNNQQPQIEAYTPLPFSDFTANTVQTQCKQSAKNIFLETKNPIETRNDLNSEDFSKDKSSEKHSANTVQTQCNTFLNAVQTQCNSIANAVQTQCENFPNKIETLSNDSANTVQTQCKHSANDSAKHSAKRLAAYFPTYPNIIPKIPFSSLIGVERIITHYLYDCCKITRELHTDAVSSIHLLEIAKTTKNTVQSAITRLKAKKIIASKFIKDGRGGWASYWLAEQI